MANFVNSDKTKIFPLPEKFYLSRKEQLTTDLLQRIISRDPLSQGIPTSFIPIYNSWPPERQREMFEDCQGSLCRALFNKNAADGFWCLFENTYQLIIAHPDEPVQQLFVRLQVLGDCVSRCPDFDAISLKYFISVVKDGIQQ